MFTADFPFSEELTDFALCSVKNRTPASVLSGNERRSFIFLFSYYVENIAYGANIHRIAIRNGDSVLIFKAGR